MRLLGVDLGTRRVGVAVSDDLGLLAHPLETLASGPSLAGDLARIAEREGARGVVLGLPLRTGGEKGPEAQRALRFGEELERCGLRVYLVDERLTTAEAERRLVEQGRSRSRRKRTVDQAAACLILQAFLDRHRSQG